MKCPNCGEEIKEGYLYCENCGEDIHIVPDYEPEFELSLMHSVEEILDEEAKEKELDKQRLLEKKLKKQKVIKGVILTGAVCLAAVVCVVIINTIKQMNFNSYDYQVEKAYACINEGNSEEALGYYERAVELNPQNAKTRLELAEVYRLLGKTDRYMEQLHIVTASSYASMSEIETAYGKLISIYDKKGEYETINRLLQGCANQNVLNSYQRYLAKTPEFSYAEGVYSEIIPLKITSNTSGTIYYTLDGSVPDTDSEKYVTPIFLDTGEYTVSVLFVNDYGIVSDVTTKKYVIEVPRPAAPDVAVYSGEYDRPVTITVEVPEGERVFYTTDGSYPTDRSLQYLGPIPMPLGKSYYKFVSYNEDGVPGEVTSREYKLSIDTEVTVDEACQAVIDVMLQNGKIYNSLGESYNEPGKYLYIFQYPLAVPDKGDYYVIIEVYEDTSGVQIKTGSEYAVNIYDEKVYKFTNSNGNYLLEGF